MAALRIVSWFVLLRLYLLLSRLPRCMLRLSCVPVIHAVSALITGQSRRGSLVLLGVGREPLHISPGWLVSGERRVLGVMTGTPRQSEQLLDYSVLTNIPPAIQTWPLDQAALAYERLRNGQIGYRAVLTSIRAG